MAPIERKLTTILAADVVSFSKMMGEDEVGTLEALKSCRAIIENCVESNRGRVFGGAGDSIIAEFASPLSATMCALEFQKSIGERNTHFADKPAMQFRVGINIGDVIIDQSNLYGDGVNIAARLEALAAPGGICLSRKVHEEIKRKVQVFIIDGGMQQLKNIDEPVSVYHIDAAVAQGWGERPAAAPGAGPAAPRRASPAPTGAERPSIAVLPFSNMSSDTEQGFFADGITEDIITALSRFPGLMVIARNSTFTYKGKAVNVTEVGRDLGVRYVVEGSVRRAGNRIRVTVQMVDAANGEHIWAERYDRELADMFELQDELCHSIAATLPGRVEMAAMQQVSRKLPEDMAAYDYLLAAKIHHHKGTREDNAMALDLLQKAINLDPNFASAYAWKACTLGQAMVRGYVGEEEKAWTDSLDAVRKAYEIDNNDVEANRILCEVAMYERDWEKARLHQERALKLNPNDPRLIAQRGELLTWLGDAEEGAKAVETAMRHDPFDAHTRAHLLGRALYLLRRYDAALDAYKLISSPSERRIADMAACYAQLGKDAEAKTRVEAVLLEDPEFRASSYVEGLLYTVEADRAHHLEGMLKAGFTA
jgi:adenylate cyclase